MSLVAAVAVAGLTSSVSAQDLSEAIKGVDVSGNFRYRAEDINTDTTSANSNKTDVEIEVGIKAPVTDTITAVFKIDNANDDAASVTKGAVNIEDYYFSYANNGLTVNFGQQNVPGRLTDASQGDGVVISKSVKGFNFGAGTFITNNANATESADLSTVFASGKAGPVSLSAQYIDLADIADSYTVKADVTVDMVTAGVEYSETDEEGNSDENDTLKLYVSAKMDALSGKLTLASTGDDGSGSIHAQKTYAAAVEAGAEFLLWQIGSATKADLDLVAIDLGYAINSQLSLRAAYADGDYLASSVRTDITETLGQVNYKFAKNLNSYFRISQLETEDATTNTDKTRGRIEVKYTF
jgi:hypothetical protein